MNNEQNTNHLQPGMQFVVVSMQDLQNVVRDAVQQTLQSVQSARSDEQVTPAQAGRLLGVAKSTLWRWAKSGYLRPVKIGAKTMYRIEDIENVKNRM